MEVVCETPNVTTSDVIGGGAAAVTLPAARVVSRDAGLASTPIPQCFIGSNGDSMTYGHSSCVAMFDGDSEVTTGATGLIAYVTCVAWGGGRTPPATWLAEADGRLSRSA